MATETYKVGEAPWETKSVPSSFPVGKAPWETTTPTETAPIALITPQPDLGGRVANEMQAGYQKVQSSIQQGSANLQKKGLGNKLLGLGQSAFGTITGLAQSAFAPITESVVKPVLNTIAPDGIFAHILEGRKLDPNTGTWTQDNSLKDKVNALVQAHPEGATLLGDIINTALMAVGGKKVAPEIKTAINDIPKITYQGTLNAPDNLLKDISSAVSTVKTNLSPTLEQSATKAFPALKKDVTNIPKKVDNIRTAFTDMAQNKNLIGLTDKMGNPRNPQNFVETVDAQQTRLPQIYKDYTAKLSEVDRPKFDENITNGISKQIDSIDSKLKVENSIDNRRALTKIKSELTGLRDISPEGIQNYIQTINQKIKPLAPGGSLTPEQIQYANLGGDLRKVLDDAIEKVGGKGYQDIRNVYASHKAIQSQLLMAVKKELNKVPSFTEKLGNIGLSVEGLNFILTHDPQALLIGGSIKGFTKYLAWLKSPQRALRNIFKNVEGQIKSSSLKP